MWRSEKKGENSCEQNLGKEGVVNRWLATQEKEWFF